MSEIPPATVKMWRRTISDVPPMLRVGPELDVRRARAEDAGALAVLLASALEGETWTTADVEREILCDPTVRATLVVAAGARLVSTASLQVQPQSPAWGRVRWVATAPDAHLDTRTDRRAAIGLYKQLGFVPLGPDGG
jgi:hypothetical protein